MISVQMFKPSSSSLHAASGLAHLMLHGFLLSGPFHSLMPKTVYLMTEPQQVSPTGESNQGQQKRRGRRGSCLSFFTGEEANISFYKYKIQKCLKKNSSDRPVPTF